MGSCTWVYGNFWPSTLTMWRRHTRTTSRTASCFLLALRIGKNIVCDKPFTVNAAQLRILADLARKEKVFTAEAAWTRFFPIGIEVRELIKSSAVGEVRRVTSELNLAQDPDEKYKDGLHRMASGSSPAGGMSDVMLAVGVDRSTRIWRVGRFWTRLYAALPITAVGYSWYLLPHLGLPMPLHSLRRREGCVCTQRDRQNQSLRSDGRGHRKRGGLHVS